MHNNLPDIIGSLDSHIADNVTMLRFYLVTAIIVCTVAWLSDSLYFALAFALIGIGLAIRQLEYLYLLRQARIALVGIQTDVQDWEAATGEDFWA